MILPASFLYAALLGLLLIALSANVVRARRRYRVGLGVGTEEGMQQAVRVQANFSEYVPFAVILLILAELTEMPAIAVHVAGIILLTSRVLHAWGLARSPGTTQAASPVVGSGVIAACMGHGGVGWLTA